MENVFHIRTTRCHRCQCGMKNLIDADASKEDVTRCPWASAVSPSVSESSCTRVNKMRTRITSRRRTKSTALLQLWLLKLANCTDLALNTSDRLEPRYPGTAERRTTHLCYEHWTANSADTRRDAVPKKAMPAWLHPRC